MHNLPELILLDAEDDSNPLHMAAGGAVVADILFHIGYRNLTAFALRSSNELDVSDDTA